MSKHLSKSRTSTNYFTDTNYNKKIVTNNIVYQQNNSGSSEYIELASNNASKFFENIDKMKSPHKAEITSSEQFGSIEDYSEYQEQKDLERYRRFINSSAYDEIKEVETEIDSQKKLTLKKLRKRGSQHDD